MPIAEELEAEFSTYIGRVAVAWSSVESSVDFAIWATAGLAPALGACITCQIYTLDGRLRALLALLKLRNAPEDIIAAVNSFADDLRGPLEIRNRIVHDNWLWNKDGRIARLEKTAPRKLKFAIVETDIASLKSNYETIKGFASRSSDLRRKIYNALPTLPQIPHEALHPVTDALLDP